MKTKQERIRNFCKKYIKTFGGIKLLFLSGMASLLFIFLPNLSGMKNFGGSEFLDGA